jgi:hypothetical protein
MFYFVLCFEIVMWYDSIRLCAVYYIKGMKHRIYNPISFIVNVLFTLSVMTAGLVLVLGSDIKFRPNH